MAERHDEQLLGFTTLDKVFPIVDTVDSLDSDVRVRPLAARQGKVLKEMIESIKTMEMKIVEELPDTGSNGIIYLVRDPESEEGNNTYIEYVWISTEQRYEVIGSLGNIKLPEGGTTGQVLTKTDDGYEWKDPKATFPEGGNVGQVLKKTAGGTEWANDENTTYENATQSTAGLMSSEDKTKLDNLVAIPSGGTDGQVLKKTSSGVAWGTDEKGFELPSGGSDGQVLKKSGATATWQDDNDTTYENATQSKAGLMSAEDKTKLDGISSAYATILTQEAYDSLNPKENNRVYYIKG